MGSVLDLSFHANRLADSQMFSSVSATTLAEGKFGQ